MREQAQWVSSVRRGPGRHLPCVRAHLLAVGWASVVGLIGCDGYGLPGYVAPETPRPPDAGVGDILDIQPKFGRQGQNGLVLSIQGLQTTFRDGTVVSFPDEPGLVVSSVRVESYNALEATLDISDLAALGVHRLIVTTTADGAMDYEYGFTVVE